MREACCPQCRGAARLVRNPYYGAGLAVHADLLVCQACGYSGFAENSAEEPDETPRSTPQKLLGRLRGAFRRR